MLGNKSFTDVSLLAGLPLFLQASFRMPWWGWLVLFLVIVLIVILLIRGSDKKDDAYNREPDRASIKRELPLEGEAAPVRVDQAADPNTPADDLTVIEGIGPKISEFLHRSGITTFRQLAAMDMNELDGMLAEANFGIADPETWAEQANLAANGDWKGLKTLQDTLTGGRRKKL